MAHKTHVGFGRRFCKRTAQKQTKHCDQQDKPSELSFRSDGLSGKIISLSFIAQLFSPTRRSFFFSLAGVSSKVMWKGRDPGAFKVLQLKFPIVFIILARVRT